MKTRAIAASAILALFFIASVSVATAHAGFLAPKVNQGVLDGDNGDGGDGNQTTTQQSTTSQSTSHENTTQQATTTQGDGSDGGSGDNEDNQSQASNTQLFVGESVTVSNLSGHFITVGNGSFEGDAKGSLTLTVTAILQDGITLSITSGHFTVGNSTFTVTTGTVVVDSEDGSATGSGTAGSAKFIIQVDGLNGSTVMPGADAIKLDLKNGASEFLVSLGTQTSSGDNSGDSSGDSSGD